MGVAVKNRKMLSRLEQVFRWLGYYLLASAAFAIVWSIREFARTDIVLADGITPANTDPFFILPQITTLVTYITQAFFVLLVGQVFALLLNGSEKLYERGDRLMIVTTIGFVLQGVSSFTNWIHNAYEWDPLGKFHDPGGNYYLAYFVMSGFSQLLTPILYAVTIFVLYRHFVQMVSFESEVV
jgi:uncharacterized membrane protein